MIPVLFLLLASSLSVSLTGEVVVPRNPADRKSWSVASVKLILDGHKFAYLDSSLSFNFENVPDGIHFLEVIHPGFYYKTMVLEVLGEFVVARESNSFKGEKIAYPLKIQTDKKITYFEERERFSIWSILMNPMLLMSLVMLGVAFMSPKMKLDPEQMTEMKEMQKQMSSGWMSSLLNPPS